MMKKLFLLITVSLIFAEAGAQETGRNVYSGGMLFYQPGYTLSENGHQQIRDNSAAIGGILRLYFGRVFTAGIYGGSQKTTYLSPGSENSFLQLGYGGPFAGISMKKGRFRYTLSAFAGMGSVKNLHIESQTATVLDEAYLYKLSAIVYAPLVSVDFALTQRINFTTQFTWLQAAYDGHRINNPTLQFGILFNR